jgi:hypothetical protein
MLCGVYDAESEADAAQCIEEFMYKGHELGCWSPKTCSLELAKWLLVLALRMKIASQRG